MDPHKARSMFSRVPISVVIPVFNARPRLPGLLSALAALSPQPEEFVFVDDGSSDDTLAFLKASTIGETPVKVLTQVNSGPAAARNRGLFAARSTYVAFTDDDCLPDPDWLGAYHRAASACPDFQVAFGRVIATGTKTYLSHYVENSGQGHQTANALYLRESLWAVGGFDEIFRTPYLEDTDLYLRVRGLGAELYASDALVEHPVRPTTLMAKVRRMRMHRNDFLLYRKHPEIYRQRHRGQGPAAYLLYYLGVKHALALLWMHRRLMVGDPKEWLTIFLTLFLERIFLALLVLRWVLIEKL